MFQIVKTSAFVAELFVMLENEIYICCNIKTTKESIYSYTQIRNFNLLVLLLVIIN